MAANTRTEGQIEKDREVIARLYVQGKTQNEMARAIGQSRALVVYDLQQIRKMWRENTMRSFDDHVGQQLARIDLLEAEAWEGLQLSKKERNTRTQFAKPDPADGNRPKPTSMMVRTDPESGGDKGYYGVIQWCIGERSKLLNLYPQPAQAAGMRPGQSAFNGTELSNVPQAELDLRIRQLEAQTNAQDDLMAALDDDTQITDNQRIIDVTPERPKILVPNNDAG